MATQVIFTKVEHNVSLTTAQQLSVNEHTPFRCRKLPLDLGTAAARNRQPLRDGESEGPLGLPTLSRETSHGWDLGRSEQN